MISRIRNWLKARRLIKTVDASGFTPSVFDPVHKEDTRAAQAVKTFNKSFDQQQQQMQARALVAHEPGCDVISCNKVSCFKVEPDKIVKSTKSKRKRIKKPIGD